MRRVERFHEAAHKGRAISDFYASGVESKRGGGAAGCGWLGSHFLGCGFCRLALVQPFRILNA